MNRYFYLSSAIHTSSVLSQRPDHRLFKDLDWDRVESGEYAIVDPLDPNAILYLPAIDLETLPPGALLYLTGRESTGWQRPFYASSLLFRGARLVRNTSRW
jgi:hypothetical protein